MDNRLPLLIFFSFWLVNCSGPSGEEKPEQERSDPAFKTFTEAKATTDIDEKLRLLSRAAKEINTPRDTLLPNILDFQIYYHSLKKDHDSSLYFSDLMINTGIKTGDTSTIAKGYYRKAQTYLTLGDQEKVLQHVYKAQRLYRSIGDSVQAGRRLVEQANAQDRLGDFTGSHQSATEALQFLQPTDSVYRSSAYNIIGLTSFELGDFEESIEEYKNALRFSASLSDSLIIHNNIALNYRELKDFKTADSIWSLALKKSDKNSPSGLRLADNYYYNRFLESGTNTAPALEEIAARRDEINDLQGLLGSYNHLSSVYAESNPAKAEKMAIKYLQISRDLGNPVVQLEALKKLITLNSGSTKGAYQAEYFRLNDSIINARNQIKNVFAKIKYDEEQKLNEIDRLRDITGTQKVELLQERNQKNLALLIGLLVIGGAGFVYYHLKQHHRKEKIREVHNTEARISKKIHDELANDVYNVMTEIEHPATFDKEKTLDKLEGIYYRTRNISRENSPVITGAGFKDNLHHMLSISTPTKSRLYLTGLNDIHWEEINAEVKSVIFRVLQEMMVNMKKHSKASLVSLNFKTTSSRLQILYRDNGVGISSERLEKGSGLQNMETRIALVNGRINFQPDTNGFSAEISIPV